MYAIIQKELYQRGHHEPGGRGRCGIYPTPVHRYVRLPENMAITSSQLLKALDNKCMFDGSAIEGFVKIEESDLFLYPDLSTLEIFPGDRSRERWHG